MRKLASIQRIAELNPIEGKDRIELATILGWRVIVQKGMYSVGDLCVYCEPDSLMPDKPEFEFLRGKNFKIKVMKMAGVISEGIVFPLSILPQQEQDKAAEGRDVTEILGVRHMDEVEEEANVPKPSTLKSTPLFKFAVALTGNRVTRPIGHLLINTLKKKGRGNIKKFPSFIRKTDETRIQTIPHILDKDETYICREKVDGSSMTVFLVRKPKTLFKRKPQYEFGVCSRNRRLYKGSFDSERFLSTAAKYKMEEALRDMIGSLDWLVLQGELVGPGIQKNLYKLDSHRFYAFNLITPHKKVSCDIGEHLMSRYDIPWAPSLGLIKSPFTVQEVLDAATGNSQINPSVRREGMVCRNYGKDISFKAVSPEYLLKKDKAA